MLLHGKRFPVKPGMTAWAGYAETNAPEAIIPGVQHALNRSQSWPISADKRLKLAFMDLMVGELEKFLNFAKKP